MEVFILLSFSHGKRKSAPGVRLKKKRQWQFKLKHEEKSLSWPFTQNEIKLICDEHSYRSQPRLKPALYMHKGRLAHTAIKMINPWWSALDVTFNLDSSTFDLKVWCHKTKSMLINVSNKLLSEFKQVEVVVQLSQWRQHPGASLQLKSEGVNFTLTIQRK